jgi:hypothetical protein
MTAIRKKFWKKLTNDNSIKVSNAIANWYAENDNKVFKGENGFTFIRNEVFGSSEELFLSLFNTINPLLTSK